MSDSLEEEYVVEYIKMAKVANKRGKSITWHYLVKWKGYDKSEDDTWEPKGSFEGAEHFIEKFWKRCRPDRDIDDPTVWNKGEEVIPVGPPRRAPKRPTSKAKEPLLPAKPPKRRVEEEDKQEKRNFFNHVSDSAPPAKRLRSKAILDSPEMNLGESASMVVDDSDADANGSATGTDFNPLFDDSPGPGSSPSAKPSSFRKPPSPQKGKELQPSLAKPVEKKKDLQAVISSIGGSHRKRAQNPLVRMHEEPQVDVTNGIRAKTRLLARNANAAGAGSPSQAPPPDAGAEKQPASNPPKPSVHPSPAPGRRKVSTRGSSLLMFNKDGPVTLRREPKRSEPAATAVVNNDNPKQISPEPSNAIIPDSTEATPDLEESAPIFETPAADLPPTPVSPVQRARQLQEAVKGLIPDTSELPEFEEETQVEESVVVTTFGPDETSGDVETITVKEIITTTTTTEAPAPTGFGLFQRIESGLGSLFGRRATPPTAATGQTSVSPIKTKPSFAKHNTIFGVLSGSGSTVTQDSTTAFIKLDTNISIPVALNEHRPPQTDDWPKNEDTIELGHAVRSEPGKFYPPEVLKPVLKVGGPSALVSVHTSATETQRADFAKFVGRLMQGNGFVFLASYGRETCLFAASENISVAEAFEIPASLTGMPEQVVVSRVDLADTMAYLDATAYAKSW